MVFMDSEKVFLLRSAEALKGRYLCDRCLGRLFGNLLSGMGNDERGRVIRHSLAFSRDAGEKLDVEESNFFGIKFRNQKQIAKKPETCSLCKGFFDSRLKQLADAAVKKLSSIEFETFLVGTILPPDMRKEEEKLWEIASADFVEPMKAEINRETGKLIEDATGKKFSIKNPDVLVLVDAGKNSVKLEPRSVFIAGGYKKLVRGIPQTKWLCSNCMGKGCIECKGEGKRYKNSVQEFVSKPALKMTRGKETAFHGSGREDIDARCLDYRPFVIEVVKPVKRKIDLAKLRRDINRSKKVEVSKLSFSDMDYVRKIKADKHDKTYAADVIFKKDIDASKLRLLSQLKGKTIEQKTPTRVSHRRANLLRKRDVVDISWKTIGRKRVLFKIRGSAGLYIKELISGDNGRTKPSVSEILGNEVKKIYLDVLKVWKTRE
jgi:tRNA pseudouridine synthase 10